MKCKRSHIFKILLSLVVLFSTMCSYATNAVSPLDDPTFNSVETTEHVMTPEEAIAAEETRIMEIQKAALSVKGTEPANLPTLLSQPEFHPEKDTDIFGTVYDTTPIFKVDVDPNDEKRKNLLALSFDSAYINKYTYKILDVLDEYNVKATFFMTMEFMQKNPAQIIEIIKRGHEIGNHTNTHPDLNLVTDAKVAIEVMQCHTYIKNLTGVSMCLFRFPFGSYSPRTVTILKLLGYYPIQWTFDSIDWRNEDKEILMNRIRETEFMVPGAIFLFHNGATYTPEVLPDVIELIKSHGLNPCRISDLIYPHNFHLNNGHQIPDNYEPEK